MKKFIFNGTVGLLLAAVIIAITAMAFTACSKKSLQTEGSTQSQTTTAEQTQTAVTLTSNLDAKILAGDLSDFVGTWVNSYERIQLKADGTFGNGTAGSFEKYSDNTYMWSIDFGNDRGTFLILYPIGTEIKEDFQYTILQTDTTKVRIVINRIDTSDKVYYREGEAPIAQTPQFVHPVQFNNQTIPITVFYSVSGADGEMMNLDRMVFMYGNTEQTINLSPKVIEAGSPQGFFSYYVIPADYNFDGFLDFAVHHGHYSSWDPDIIYKVFLYNQQTANYSINDELSKLPNVRANNETQTVISVDGPVTSEYKWVSGKLELIKSVNQAFSGPQ